MRKGIEMAETAQKTEPTTKTEAAVGKVTRVIGVVVDVDIERASYRASLPKPAV